MNWKDAECQKIVGRIDTSLMFSYPLSLYKGVYKVERKGSFYVLKFCHSSDACSGFVPKERRLLQRAAGVEGVTHLVHDYGKVGGYNAILKEYFDGARVSDFGRIEERELQEFLVKTVGELHGLGFAKLDIKQRNIVISPDRKQARIVDFDSYSAQDAIGHDMFEELKHDDLEDLKTLFA